jgi:hypothetical protein
MCVEQKQCITCGRCTVKLGGTVLPGKNCNTCRSRSSRPKKPTEQKNVVISSSRVPLSEQKRPSTVADRLNDALTVITNGNDNALEEDFKIKCIKSASKVKEQDDINEEEKDTNNDEEMSPNQQLYFMQYLDSLCDTSDSETYVDYLPPEDAESEVDIAQYVVEEETNQRRSTRAAVFSQDYREYLQDCLDNDRKIKRRKL